MAGDPKPAGRLWPALREKAGAIAAYLLASATIAGGTATAVAHPDLGLILAIMIVAVIPGLASSAMWWSVQRRHQQMQWEYQLWHQEIAAKALADPEDENLRLLLIIHAGTRPDHLGPPPSGP
jgi:acyl-CoA synthetase (AMP-forming)/AMP-acid ligase II